MTEEINYADFFLYVHVDTGKIVYLFLALLTKIEQFIAFL